MKKVDPYYWEYRNTLEAIALRLLNDHCPDGPPFDPFRIAEALKVGVRLAHLDGLDGYVEFKEKEKCYAVLPVNGNPARKRFTLSHELGHVVLFRAGPKGVPKLKRYRTTAFRPSEHHDPIEESLCDDFATQLLMPFGEFQDRLRKYGVHPLSIFNLAREFDVSIQAAVVRTRQVLRKRFVSCSFWDLKAPWPVPRWWVGKKTRRVAELSRLEMLVRHDEQTDELWKCYNGSKYTVRVQISHRARGALALVLVSTCFQQADSRSKVLGGDQKQDRQLELFGFPATS